MAHKRQKLLYLAKLFKEKTDEEHTVGVNDMIEYLARQGIHAERKAIYEDLELLREIGMDIVHVKTKTHNYYLGQRDFELPELTLLIDVVQASPFLTAKKSMTLIRKLTRLASEAQAGRLRRQVYVLNRVRTQNEQLYYNIDGIHEALNENKCIQFRYFDWTANGKRSYRHGGKYYTECPAALCVDRNYYLITYRQEEQKFIHFRADRISALRVIEQERPDLPEDFDPASYVRNIFDMHSGDTQRVTLRLERRLLNAAMDRFGREAAYLENPDGTVNVTAEVEVSPTFLSWVLCFGSAASILSPDSAREGLQKLARDALAQYE